MAGRIQGKTGTLHLTDSSNNLQFVVDTQNMTINESSSNEQISVHGTTGAITVSSEETYTVTFDGLISTEDAGQLEIKKGTGVDWTWYVTADQTSAGPAYSGTFVISSLDRSFPADGRVTFSVSADGSGDLVKANIW